MMAANYHDRYYRVLVTELGSEEVVTGVFIDIGSSAEIAIWDLVNLRQTLALGAPGKKSRGP